MRCFLMCVILAGASAAWADNLPPVPKTVSIPISAVIVPEGRVGTGARQGRDRRTQGRGRLRPDGEQGTVASCLCQGYCYASCLCPRSTDTFSSLPRSANAAGSQN